MDAEFLREGDPTKEQAEFIAYLDESDLQKLVAEGGVTQSKNGDIIDVNVHTKQKQNTVPFDDVMDALQASYMLIKYLKHTRDDFDEEIARVNPTAKIEKTYEYYSEIQEQYE